jgi:hypothetical protein
MAFVGFIGLKLNIRFSAGLDGRFTKLFKLTVYRGPPGRSVCERWTSANKFSLADFGVFGSVKFG